MSEDSMESMNAMWHEFDSDISSLSIPAQFTYPFCYDPHPLALKAARQLTDYIEKLFFNEEEPEYKNFNGGIGKMFGVLVVEKKDGQLGFISAFSGKLYNSNHHKGFVPPVFDTLHEGGFYKKGEAEINILNRRIENMESDQGYIDVTDKLKTLEQDETEILQLFKKHLKSAKHQRKIQRENIQYHPDSPEYKEAMVTLDKESIHDHYQLKKLKKSFQLAQEILRKEMEMYATVIKEIKDQRRKKSGELQSLLFQNYRFLNARHEYKDLVEIFDIHDDFTPPSGAGECAAPKLLQYAFMHQLKPVAMAEFWFGVSPGSEIRKHGMFYPACISKCKPILSHMMIGLQVEENPLLVNPAKGKSLPVIYEDEAIIIVNKPPEFLSVPGKTISDSVSERVKNMCPDIKGPVVIHRLDMSTSGIMILAKNKDVHQFLQRQFITRKIHKRYVAILEGRWNGPLSGEIKLPMRVDLDNRPRQLVCDQYGKPSHTKYDIVSTDDHFTRIYFYPVTGRTHQLRVHASHPGGLNLPIWGDDLYGTKKDRLYLHADTIEFIHPLTRQKMTIHSDPDF